MISNTTRTAVVTVVTTIWVVNFLAGFFVVEYKPSESVNGIFMLIVGSAFALGSKKDGGGGEAQ